MQATTDIPTSAPDTRVIYRDIASGYDGCSSAAISVLQAAVQVTVVDPEWGREGNLWRALAHVPLAGAA